MSGFVANGTVCSVGVFYKSYSVYDIAVAPIIPAVAGAARVLYTLSGAGIALIAAGTSCFAGIIRIGCFLS